MLSVGWFQNTWAPGANFRCISRLGDHLKPGRQTFSSKKLATNTKRLSIFQWGNDPVAALDTATMLCFFHSACHNNWKFTGKLANLMSCCWRPSWNSLWYPCFTGSQAGVLKQKWHHDLSMPRLAYHPACHSVHEARKPISPQVESCRAPLSTSVSACRTKLRPVRVTIIIRSLEDHLQQPSSPSNPTTNKCRKHQPYVSLEIYSTDIYVLATRGLFVQKNSFRSDGESYSFIICSL